MFGLFGRLPVGFVRIVGRRLGVVLLLARQAPREVRSAFTTPLLGILFPGLAKSPSLSGISLLDGPEQDRLGRSRDTYCSGS